jgi:adenylate kinase family enzyme
MRRVLVIGAGGAGKSTLAARIGAATGLPVVHLDALYWRPGWTERPKDEWAGLVAEIASEPAWVMDGNYSGTLEQRLRACDAVVFLDLPRLACVRGVVARWLRHRGRTRADMAPACPEQLTWQFLRWIWDYRRRSRPKVLRLIGEHAAGKRVIVLRSRREVERFVASLG